jgi:hypothetical protein
MTPESLECGEFEKNTICDIHVVRDYLNTKWLHQFYQLIVVMRIPSLA